jgi:LPXTG-site transpeptidase (sortase) family protein
MLGQIKKLYKPFIVLFLVAFLLINWSDISWIFNYRAVAGYVSDIFSKDRSPSGVAVEARENGIEIPKLQLSIPLIINTKLSDSEVNKSLDLGAVLYPGSALPGVVGQTIILGHSAPLGWPKIKHDWIFSHISELVAGDEIFVYSNNRKFTFLVTKNLILNRGDEIPQDQLAATKNVLVLITCWPPGKDHNRMAVEAILEK